MTQKVLASYTDKASGTTVLRQRSYRVASSLLNSFCYAWAGVVYAFQTQRNFRIHTAVGLSAIALSGLLKLPPVEVAVILLTIGIVMGLELLNTALEAVVDLTVGKEYHELARIAKDCAAGAVLLSAMAAVGVAIALIVPPLVYPIVGTLL
ncbi:diacylglycerol kinase family protein [Thermosynechococcus sp. HN-54]|uniref:diacylglycerol kinase n=1 Tax=Thermosynechococcus sp. HN-54 TaxID=2933959 RepID=UPI00202CCB36|nr:diacylglycerol kinase family protein [Thermosynechococcus sp. HN-54]URR36535.1 diacylglycerol kinase family protein [Thermosynechococcus sp. HN-54]